MEEILNQVLSAYGDTKLLHAVYIFDIEQTEISYRVVNKDKFQEQKSYETLQNIIELAKRDDFKMILMDFSERYFIRKILNDKLMLIISDSSEPIGRFLTIVNRIKVSKG